MRELLSSPHNPLLKEVRGAISRGALTSSGECVAEGFHLLDEALRSAVAVSRILVAASAEGRLPAAAGRHPVTLVSDAAFAKVAATETTQGVITLVRWHPRPLPPAGSVTPAFLVLDGLQDPGNAGTMLRSAEAFGATAVLSLRGSVRAAHPKTLRAAAGSAFRVPLAEGLTEEGLQALLQTWRCPLLAALPDAPAACWDADFTGPFALAIGSEGQGLRPALAEAATGVRIPTAGVESLNAAAAAAILLYEVARQRARRP